MCLGVSKSNSKKVKLKTPKHFVVIDADNNLRNILILCILYNFYY